MTFHSNSPAFFFDICEVAEKLIEVNFSNQKITENSTRKMMMIVPSEDSKKVKIITKLMMKKL